MTGRAFELYFSGSFTFYTLSSVSPLSLKSLSMVVTRFSGDHFLSSSLLGGGPG